MDNSARNCSPRARPRMSRSRLQGSIANGKISVKEIIHESDYGGSTYTGTLKTQKWKEVFEGSTGIETITLSDGFGMIGLTRTIKDPNENSIQPMADVIPQANRGAQALLEPA